MSSYKSIAELAYQFWVSRGRSHGFEEEDWFAAERQLALAEQANAAALKTERGIDAALQESFPASDAPASRAPDITPCNASEKWIAENAKRQTNQFPVDETDNAPATAPGDIGEG